MRSENHLPTRRDQYLGAHARWSSIGGDRMPERVRHTGIRAREARRSLRRCPTVVSRVMPVARDRTIGGPAVVVVSADSPAPADPVRRLYPVTASVERFERQ